MKRVWTQLTVNKAEQQSKSDHGLKMQRIRMINSLAKQMDISGAVNLSIKDTEPAEDGTEQQILETDIVVMTVEEARFLMKHARDVTAEELDMALKLQADAKPLFMELQDIPKDELPMEFRDRRNEG